MTIELTPEQERWVREEAAKHGTDDKGYVMALVTYAMIATNRKRKAPAYGHLQTNLSPEEWGRRFDEWVNSHDAGIAPLPDEAFTRESFYEDRG
jgi:hypothetical protein